MIRKKWSLVIAILLWYSNSINGQTTSQCGFSVRIVPSYSIIQRGEGVIFNPVINPSTAILTHLWSPPLGLDCWACADPGAWPNETTLYSLYSMDVLGCTDTAYSLVVVNNSTNCAAYFDLSADSIPHRYTAVNFASGQAPLTYLWNWGDGKSDTTSHPSHTYDTAGNYTICLTISDANGCVDTFCNSYNLLKTSNPIIEVNVIAPVSTRIIENSIPELSLYPNPASDYLVMELPMNISSAKIGIYNTLGQLELSFIGYKSNDKIDITGLADGVLIVEVETDNYVSRQKLLKQ